ncbi:MAG: beta-galactosidase [Anaerolineales bacterium]|nr:beta-galactosidase [Anaerolineales bacterium]
MKLGVCYYPEHWPAGRWAEDARLMRQAGLDYVRIGEFAWAQMEPSEGRYDWGWLDHAIETLAGEGLQIVLGTPTAAPPVWLAHAYPEILPVDAQGRRRRAGSRRHYCHSSPAYRQHTRRIVGAMAARYGTHSALAGWQIDNEFGCYETARCYCETCAAGFRDWLRGRYGSLGALNLAWGADFWGQVYTDWEQIEPPNLTVAEPNPSHVLDYWRFSADALRDYQQMQVDILREGSPGKFVTHNFMGHFPDLDAHALAQPLDFACWDSYPTGYAEKSAELLYAEDEPRPACAYDLGDPYVTGFCHDLTRGLKGAPYWVMEQQCGNVNWSRSNTGIRAGALPVWTWHALASGAEAVVYFRWRACRYGLEQHHSGLLHHDGSPATGYTDLLELAKQRELMAHIAAQPLQAQVALLLDYNDLWALQIQPHREGFSYLRHLFIYYRALARLGVAADIAPASADLEKYKLLIAPTVHLVDGALVEKLEAFVRQGGRLLLGVRSGFKTPSNLVVEQPLPGLLRHLIGARVGEWHALPDDVSYDFETRISGLRGPASFWAEALDPEPGGAEALARYSAGPFEGRAALSGRAMGQGRVFYVGWYPSPAQAGALLAYLAADSGVNTLPGLPEGLVILRRGPYRIGLNFSEAPLSVKVDGGTLQVEPRSVAVRKTSAAE